MQLERVHGCHGQPGAVDDATDVAVELDVGADVGFLGLNLGWVLLRSVAPLFVAAMPEGGIVVEPDLAVDRDDGPFAREHERIDLDQRRVHVDEDAVQVGEHLTGRSNGRGRQPEPARQRPTAECGESLNGVDGDAQHRARVGSVDFFNRLSAFGRRHYQRLPVGAIDLDREVVLLGNRGLLFDQHGGDRHAIGSGLDTDQPGVLFHHGTKLFERLFGAAGEPYAAAPATGDLSFIPFRIRSQIVVDPGGPVAFDDSAFAAPTGVDLRLDHNVRTVLFDQFTRFPLRSGRSSTGDGNPMRFE